MLPLFVTKSKAAPTGKGRSSTPTKRSHVAICTFTYPPQPETFFLLSRKIAAANRDVQVTIFTDAFNAMYLYSFWDPEEDHNLSLVPVGNWTPSPPPDATLAEHLTVYMNEISPNLRESFDHFEEELGSKITYVVADAFLAGVCREIAEERGVRWSAVWNSSATSLASYMHSDVLQRKMDELFITLMPDHLISESLNNAARLLPGLPDGIPTHSLPYGVFPSISDPPVLSEFFRSMALSLPKAEAVIINSFQNLESSVTTALLNKTFHFGGPFSFTLPFPPIELERTEAIFSFLDGRDTFPFPEPVLYINLSESNAVSDNELGELANALEAIKVPFLWYIAPRWLAIELPEGFVERTSKSGQGLVVSYGWGGVRMEVLERKVLSHKAVGMQLRNGSWRSVTESIATGVPIICKPTAQKFDQALNAALVSTWGIGVGMDSWFLSKYFLAEEQPSWLDDLLNEPETPVRRGHRRSSSDSFAYMDTACISNMDYASTTLQNGTKYKSMASSQLWGSQSIGSYKEGSFYADPNSYGKPRSATVEWPLNSATHPGTLLSSKDNSLRQSAGSSSTPQQDNSHTPDDLEPGFLAAKPLQENKNDTHTKITSENDTKRAKQQFAQRSRVRKLQYIAELERNVQALQAEGSEASAELEFHNQQNLILSMENKALKQRLESLAQEKLIKYLEHEVLEREIGRLRALYQQQQQPQQASHYRQPSTTLKRTNSKELESQFANLSLKHNRDATSGADTVRT